MNLRTITQYRNWKDKRVLVRVDFNVPIKKKRVLDDTRIRAALFTIEYLQKKGAKIILMTHLGRPDGKVVKAFSIDPVLQHLQKITKSKIVKLETGNWKLSDAKKLKILHKIDKMKAGSIAMMENVRFIAGEEDRDMHLAEEFANMADIFVLDGFGVSHRSAVSVDGVAQFLPSYAGLLVSKEVTKLSKLIKAPRKPFTAVLGGVKMATKVPVIKKLSPKTTRVLIGGGIANTYLHGSGYYVGSSVVDRLYIKETLAACNKKKVITPIDVVVGDMKGTHTRVVEIKTKPHRICKRDEYILDIGPATIDLYASYIQTSKTLLWNGAMGYFEQRPYDNGTMAIATKVATVSKDAAYGVIGGGETVQAMEHIGRTADVDVVSTGGGAMLAFLAGGKLSGLEAVRKK